MTKFARRLFTSLLSFLLFLNGISVSAEMFQNTNNFNVESLEEENGDRIQAQDEVQSLVEGDHVVEEVEHGANDERAEPAEVISRDVEDSSEDSKNEFPAGFEGNSEEITVEHEETANETEAGNETGDEILPNDDEVSAEDDHGDLITEGTWIEEGTLCSGTIGYIGDEDFFRFTVPYKAECTMTTTSASSLRNTFLYDGNKKRLGQSFGSNAVIRQTLALGTYYLGVNGHEGSYMIGFTVDTAEDQDGDSMDMATMIEDAVTYDAIVNYQGDEDYFRFDLPYKAECVITMESTASRYLFFYNGDKTRLAQRTGTTGTISQLLDAGTYYLGVNGPKGEYSVSYRTVSEEDDHSDLWSMRTPLESNVIYEANINYTGDEDFFQITVPYKSECTVAINSEKSRYLFFYDGNNKRLAHETGTFGEVSMLLEPGIYYVGVNGVTGKYSVQYTIDTSEDEHGDTSADATILETGMPRDGTINYNGDRDYFKLEVLHKAECVIGIVSTSDIYANIYDESDVLLKSVYGIDKTMSMTLEEGTYYVMVLGNKAEYTIEAQVSKVPGMYAGIKPPPEVHITKADIESDIAAGLYTQEDYDYLVALSEEDNTYEGFYAVACNVRARVNNNAYEDSFKKVVTSGAYVFAPAHVGRIDIGDNDRNPIRNAAVSVLRGGHTTIKDYCFFYGRINGNDMWFDKNQVGQNLPIVIGSGPFRNVYGARLEDLHNKGTGGSGNNIVTLYDDSESKWYDD